MAFIKVGNLIINTSFVVAVKLTSQIFSEEKNVSILMISLKSSALPAEANRPNYCQYEWLNFTGKEAESIQGYFSNCGNLLHLDSPEIADSE